MGPVNGCHEGGQMKRNGKIIMLLLSMLCVSVFGADIEKEMWKGVLKAGAMELRLVFHVYETEDGSLRAEMDSVDQGAYGLPAEKLVLKDGHYEFYFDKMKASYIGDLDPDSGTIKGKFAQSGLSFEMDLERISEKIEIKRPQEPKPPFPYEEEEVSYVNKIDGNTLAGTLTFPSKEGKFPAVILITGSGTQNRNEEIFNHKPFLVIADRLSRNGFAVLRVDDRGAGGSSALGLETSTSENYSLDVLAGVEFLKSHPNIDAAKIGLIGHSEGGLIAPMVYAAAPDDIAFMVLLAGPGVTGKDVITAQKKLIMEAMGVDKKSIKASFKADKKVYKIIFSKDTIEEKRAKVRKLIIRYAKKEGQKLKEEELEAKVRTLTIDWMLFFLAYDPRPTLKKVLCPVLSMNGKLDLQVPYEENLAEIGKALDAAGNKNHTEKAFEKLNHLFQHCETGLISEYGVIEETFAPEALDFMTDWLKETVK